MTEFAAILWDNIYELAGNQAMMHPQIATAISLLRGILLNGLFLFVFPLFLGGNGIWWAIFGAEIITMFFAAGYVFYLFRRFQSER